MLRFRRLIGALLGALARAKPTCARQKRPAPLDTAR